MFALAIGIRGVLRIELFYPVVKEVFFTRVPFSPSRPRMILCKRILILEIREWFRWENVFCSREEILNGTLH